MGFLTAFLSGAMFALGLAVSGMIKPSKVVGFLDITGEWDPTLAFVMGGALAVFLPTYRLVSRRSRPLLAPKFDVPRRRDITWQLVVGAVIFGVGWGVSGLCPAAGIAALPAMEPTVIAITVGMAIGIVVMRSVTQVLVPKQPTTVADF